MPIEQAIADLSTANTTLTVATNVTKASLDADVATATSNTASTGADLTAVNAVSTVASTQATNATASASTAVTSADQALAQWATSMYPAQTLPAISKTLHSGNVVRSIIYDTAKDSDGGAWRKRCQDKSWFTEQIYGKWLGQQQNELSAINCDGTLGTELISNGTFDTNTTGWTLNSATIASVGGELQITNSGAAYGFASQAFTTVIGKTYLVTATFRAGTSTYSYFSVGNTPASSTLFNSNTSSKVNVTQSGSFVATATTTYVTPNNDNTTNGTGFFDNISVKEVTATSRVGSVNLLNWSNDLTNAAWIVNGTATKASATVANFPGSTSDYLYQVIPTVAAGNPRTVAVVLSGSGTVTLDGFNTTDGTLGTAGVITLTGTPTLYVANIANVAGTGTTYLRFGRFANTATTVTFGGAGLFIGTFTAPQITAAGGIPLTTNAPAAAALSDYYQNTTDGKFYAVGSKGGQAEIFRGNVREFPASVAAVIENQRVVIYDLTQPGTPMWMAFRNNNGILFAGSNNTCIAAGNGQVIVGQSSITGIARINFITDLAVGHRNDTRGYLVSGLVNRQSPTQTSNNLGYWSAGLVDGTANDIAITVLPDAPIDPATGLPVPTVAVATNGGISVIKHDGTVVNSADAGAARAIHFDALGRVRWNAYGGLFACSPVPPLSAGFSNGTSRDPLLLNGPTAYSSGGSFPTPVTVAGGTSARNAFAGQLGLNRYVTSQFTVNGMAAGITNTYNSGWQVGDSRMAALADTSAESITAPELVSNGGFDTDIAGWSAAASPAGTTVAYSAGQLMVTSSAGGGHGEQYLTNLVVGKTYRLTGTATGGTSGASLSIVKGPTGGYAQYGTTTPAASGGGIVRANIQFVATHTDAYVVPNCVDIGTAYFDNISVKLSDADRSAKNNGLNITGTLTKTAVASGAQLVNYSGFSAANYLTQPYSANLDFGTAEFDYGAWVTVPANIGTSGVFPNTLAPNLITNGDFTTNTTGWTNASAGTGTATSVSGVLSLTRAVGLPNTGALDQSFATVVGKVYRISFDASAASCRALIGSAQGNTDILVLNAPLSAGYFAYFVATTTTTWLRLNLMVDNSTGTFDSVAVREASASGAELATNGDFSNGATGWILSTVDAAGGATVSSGAVTITSNDGTYKSATQIFSAVVGRQYLLTITCTAISGASPLFSLGLAGGTGTGTVSIASTGTYSVVVVPNVVTPTFEIKRAGAGNIGTATFDNISVREVTDGVNLSVNGDFGAGYNHLLHSQDLSNAVWSKANCTVATGRTDPLGGTTSEKIVSTASTNGMYVRQSFAFAANTTYTYTAVLKAAGCNFAYVMAFDGIDKGIVFDLTTGALGQINGGATGYAVSLGGGWFRCSITFTTSASPTTNIVDIRLQTSGSAGSIVGDGIIGVDFYTAQLENGSVATTYSPTTTVAGGNSWMNWGSPTVTYANGAVSFVASSQHGITTQNSFTLTAGKTYQLIATGSTTAGGICQIGVVKSGVWDGPSVNGTTSTTPATLSATFVATGGSTYQVLAWNSGASSATITVDNITLKEIDPACIIDRSSPLGQSYKLGVDPFGNFVATLFDGTTTRTARSPLAYNTATPQLVSATYKTTGALELTVNDSVVATTSGTALATMTNTQATLTVGNNAAATAAFPGSISLLAISATAPTNDQRNFIYRTELPLFQANAKCTIDGTSPAVVALASDTETGLLHVGTSWGRSTFQDLIRVSSELTPLGGSVNSLSGARDMILISGPNGSTFRQTAQNLVEECERQEEGRAALCNMVVEFEYDAVTSQTAFVLPKGYSTRAVFAAGVLKRLGSTKDYTTSFDGFQESVNFVTAPGNAVFVLIQATRTK